MQESPAWVGRTQFGGTSDVSSSLFCLQMIYKAQSKQEMAKVSTTGDSVDILRAKWAQQLTNNASST